MLTRVARRGNGGRSDSAPVQTSAWETDSARPIPANGAQEHLARKSPDAVEALSESSTFMEVEVKAEQQFTVAKVGQKSSVVLKSKDAKR